MHVLIFNNKIVLNSSKITTFFIKTSIRTFFTNDFLDELRKFPNKLITTCATSWLKHLSYCDGCKHYACIGLPQYNVFDYNYQLTHIT